MESGQKLELIESGEEWSKVKSSNDLVGYILTNYLIIGFEGSTDNNVAVTDKLDMF